MKKDLTNPVIIDITALDVVCQSHCIKVANKDRFRLAVSIIYIWERDSVRIRLSKEAAKAVEVMDAKRKKLIKDAIKGIPQGDIKPLNGKSNLFQMNERV